MQKRQLAGVLALVVFLLAFWAGAGRLKDHTEANNMTIVMLSVGKADALIVQQAEQTILIDAGEQEDGEKVVKELRRRGVDGIDLFLVTHFDKDHVGGAAYVMEHMEVSAVMMPDYEGDRQEYRFFLESLQGHPNVRRPTELVEMTMGELHLEICPPDDPEALRHPEKEYDNDLSLVVSIQYKDKKFLLTGDIEKDRMEQMLASGRDWKHDVIKMPHHGKYQNVLPEFLEAVSPQAAVICCSEKNPAEEKTLKLLEDQGISVWDTSKQNVIIECDGETIKVRHET